MLFGAEWHDGEVVAQSNTKKDCDRLLQEEERQNSSPEAPEAMETSQSEVTDIPEAPEEVPLVQAVVPDHANFREVEPVAPETSMAQSMAPDHLNAHEVAPVTPGPGMVMETSKSGEETEGPEGSEAQEGPLKEEVLMTLTLPVDTSGQALGDNIPAALEFDLLPGLGMSESDEGKTNLKLRQLLMRGFFHSFID